MNCPYVAYISYLKLLILVLFLWNFVLTQRTFQEIFYHFIAYLSEVGAFHFKVFRCKAIIYLILIFLRNYIQCMQYWFSNYPNISNIFDINCYQSCIDIARKIFNSKYFIRNIQKFYPFSLKNEIKKQCVCFNISRFTTLLFQRHFILRIFNWAYKVNGYLENSPYSV